ncbi:MAG: 50S ribosomal protein L24 [Holosporales bacterium]|jgi:large subunit ribosomal protein L24|nr:50S ribosomal protein L24 [Holosporales bacterium]
MTQPKFKIKRGDLVQVITGKNRGAKGVVKQVFLDKAKVIVENVNVVVRNVKPDYMHPQGSYKKEMPIHISNVSLIDSSTGLLSKVGYKIKDDGSKVRYFKKSGSIL